MAPLAWNAGFSRHSGPQGRGRFVATPRAWARAAEPSRRIRSVPPPAFGGLCRLKPAFQAVPASLGLSVPARRSERCAFGVHPAHLAEAFERRGQPGLVADRDEGAAVRPEVAGRGFRDLVAGHRLDAVRIVLDVR